MLSNERDRSARDHFHDAQMERVVCDKLKIKFAMGKGVLLLPGKVYAG